MDVAGCAAEVVDGEGDWVRGVREGSLVNLVDGWKVVAGENVKEI